MELLVGPIAMSAVCVTADSGGRAQPSIFILAHRCRYTHPAEFVQTSRVPQPTTKQRMRPVAVETSEPFSEIEREVRKLERLLNHKTMKVEILQETLDIARASEPMSQSSQWSGRSPGLPGRTTASAGADPNRNPVR